MKKIISVVRPFAMKQCVYVYDDTNRVDILSPTLNELNDSILSLSQKYTIDTVDFVGPKDYNKKLAQELKQAEMNKFNKNSLTINII